LRPLSGRSAIAEEALADGLAPLARLALAYAPAGAREAWLTVLALDARLAGVVRGAREPMLAQLKLAWWRDRFASDPAAWPRGEPLLARLARWHDPAALGALADGWEALLGEPPLGKAAHREFAQGRVAAMLALADELGEDAGGVEGAATVWSFAELAIELPEPAERAAAIRLLDNAPALPAMTRPMRPLAVLAGVTRRAARRGGAAQLYRPGSFLAAVRIGLIGR